MFNSSKVDYSYSYFFVSGFLPWSSLLLLIWQVLGGVTQVSFLKSLAENENQKPILGYLKDIASHLLNKSAIKYVFLFRFDTIKSDY